jgi:hypothetical protein
VALAKANAARGAELGVAAPVGTTLRQLLFDEHDRYRQAAERREIMSGPVLNALIVGNTLLAAIAVGCVSFLSSWARNAAALVETVRKRARRPLVPRRTAVDAPRGGSDA